MSKKKRTKIEEDEMFDDIVRTPITTFKPSRLKPKNESQKNFIKLIKDNEIIVCSGPSGCGKSYISLAVALELLEDKSKNYRKLVICTPMVEADERIGYLPGSVLEKAEPYIASSMALIDKVITKANREKLVAQGIIEFNALGFIRGCNIDNSLLVCEESQNMTPNQMKTLLTRIGENSKFIISGDIEQSDKYKSGKQSGLYDAMTRLRTIEEIAFFTFNVDDIVRNPIIGKILNCYNEPTSKEFKSNVEYELVDSGKNLELKPKKQLLTENDQPLNNPTPPHSQLIKEGKDPVDLIREENPLPMDILRKESWWLRLFQQ